MEISKILTAWYRKNGRELPWRLSRDPYKVWISEIILQQTRVEQGLPYYYRYIERFPDAASLANASLEDVLNVWQGLGYYTRAKNMHATAKILVNEYGGKFPGSYRELIALKGIGPYTAAAIASICFGERIPAVDGNLKRVLSRLMAITDDVNSAAGYRQIGSAGLVLMKDADPGEINQSIMDLGATVCKPVPDCGICPLGSYCQAYQLGMVSRIPLKRKNHRKTTRYFYYAVIRYHSSVYIQQRKMDDIWHMLYQFPLFESNKPLKEDEIIAALKNSIPVPEGILKIRSVGPEIKHILSHQNLFARFIELEKTSSSAIPAEWNEVRISVLDEYPFPRLIHRYISGSSFLNARHT
jgi:A/G-specific adenine glycosylase